MESVVSREVLRSIGADVGSEATEKASEITESERYRTGGNPIALARGSSIEPGKGCCGGIGAKGGIGNLITGGDITCPKNAEK